MSKNFSQLRQKMLPQAQKLAAIKTQELLNAMPLQELRQARHYSQQRLAEILSTKQANLSRIERR
ncbi:MAG: transcriptional regulator, partial [Gammaproteobacteria bacterium]